MKQLEIDCLKAELQRESKQMCLLEQKIEIMLAQATPPHTSIVQIQKLIAGADSKDWDGDIWGDPDENSSNEMKELEEMDVQPLTKTEKHTGLRGVNP